MALKIKVKGKLFLVLEAEPKSKRMIAVDYDKVYEGNMISYWKLNALSIADIDVVKNEDIEEFDYIDYNQAHMPLMVRKFIVERNLYLSQLNDKLL